MNNLLPSTVKLHEKYDMKGSTYKRKASKHERAKKYPTLKDLDFMENHPDGLSMEKDTYDALIKTLQRDTRVCLTQLCGLWEFFFKKKKRYFVVLEKTFFLKNMSICIIK